MSEKISPELDYSPVVSNHSTCVFRNVSPQGSNSVALNLTAPVGPTEFIIPPSCFRFDKSRLNFTTSVLPAVAANFNYVNANLLTAISRITLYDSATNAVWCDISNVNNYASLVVPACTDFKDYATKSWRSTTPAATVANAQLATVEDISKCNVLTTNENGAGATSIAAENPYFARRQFYRGASNTAVALDVSIPLSAFKLSVLASEKLMYCPSNLCLQIHWSANNTFAFYADSATNASSGTTSLAAAITLSNISLTLANEGNLAIVSQVINKVMTSGISLPIAYPTVAKQTQTAPAQSYQLSLTRGYGNRILALVSGFFSQAGTSSINVHVRGFLTQYNTFLNNVAIKSQSGFNTLTSSQDYIVANREYLEGSVIQTLGEYVNAEWVHIDSFFGEKPIKDVNQHEIDGLDVGAQSSTWQVQATLSEAANYSWVTVIIGQKQLSISNQGSLVQ